MQFITKEQLQNLIKFDAVFTKTKKAYQLFSQGKTITPPFTVFTIPESKGSVHFKCGYVPGEKYFAMKYSGAFYGNEQLGISNFLGLFLVFNAKTGEVEAIIDDKDHYAPMVKCPECDSFAIEILNGKDIVVKNIVIEKPDDD